MAALTAGDVTKGQALILYQPDIGYVRAWSAEDKGAFEGFAYLNVAVNSENLPGISEMTINTNVWEVYDVNDLDILKRIFNENVRLYISR